MKPALRQHLDQVFVFVLAALCYVLFFHGLGGIGLIGPDEPRYSAIAREMLATGDYITPRLYGNPWFEKPPLMYWFAALGFKIFGVNEFGARFPSALGATLSVFAVFWCGRRLWDRILGFLAAVILASSIGFFAFARAASMDMPLTACLTLAMVFFLLAIQDQSPHRHYWLYGFYAAIGLGILAKGPVALLLPALSLCGFNVLRGKWKEWRISRPGLLWITVAVAAPWYALCGYVNGWPFIQEFFINQNFARFTSTIHGHERPIYFYFPALLLLTFPWTFVLISAIRRRFGKAEQFLAWWAIVPFVFFSLSGSKLPGYILPMVPPIAFLCAKELLQPASRLYRIGVFIEAGLFAFIGVAFGFFGSMLNVNPHVSGMLIFAITIVIATILCVMALWVKPPWFALFNGAVITALVIMATTTIFPRFDLTDTMRPWENVLAQIAPPDQTVVMYKPARWVEYGLQYYRNNRVRGVFSQEELAEAIRNEPRVLCIADDKALAEVSHVDTLDVEVVHTIGNESAFWIWQTK
jgi:4-amino-4-deoxy-L-arabinose transferase-like glycosyltransferase